MEDVPFRFDTRFRQQIDEKVQHLSQWVTAGNCESFESYQLITGQIHGLKVARQTFDDLVEQWENR